jgi:Ca2+-binding RTX toxin-like protein
VIRTTRSAVRRAAPLALGLAALAAPAAAQAGTLTLDGPNLSYTATPGQSSSIFYTRDYGQTDAITIGDTGGGVTSGDPRCTPVGDQLRCTGVTGTIRIDAGDGNDTIANPSGDTITNSVEVHGGPGNDTLKAPEHGSTPTALFGDDGNDTLAGGDQSDDLHGGAGDDKLDGNAGTDQLRGDDGNDTLDGDEGNKGGFADLLDGGNGIDRVAGWTSANNDMNVPISITVNGVADDGRPGEGDNVISIERQTANVSGSFTYTDADDQLEVYANDHFGPSTIATNGGNDAVTSGETDETIDTGSGNDRIDAGYGNDTITPGPGRDVVSADMAQSDCGILQSCRLPQGNDTVNAVDGEVDTISCGVGTDTVNADPVDVVGTDCEVVNRAGASPAGGTKPGAGAGSGTGPKAGGAAKPKPKLRVAAERHGRSIVVSGRLPKTLRSAKVTLRLRAKGTTVATTSTRVGRTGAFHAKLRTKGKRHLTLTLTVAATATTAQTTRTLAIA